jgi:ABC-2 type transport system ATP-binding protein
MDEIEPPALAVRTEGVVKRFGREIALAGIGMHVPAGSVYLLAGTNGAGKSTLLRTLLNIERPDAGSATVLGLDTCANGPAVRAQIGYVPETGEGVYRWMRAGAFLAHHSSFYPGWDANYAAQLVKLLDVRLNSRMGALSKGQARRVQIVTALAHRPRLLMLDELTDGLDPLARAEVLSLLASHLADTGCTAVLSTHLIGEVETLVDRVGVLRTGRLVAEAPAEAVLSQVKRYHLDARSDWPVPDTLAPRILRRDTGLGSSTQLVMAGDEAAQTAAIQAAGVTVREVTRLSLADAVLILLQSETSHVFA